MAGIHVRDELIAVLLPVLLVFLSFFGFALPFFRFPLSGLRLLRRLPLLRL